MYIYIYIDVYIYNLHCTVYYMYIIHTALINYIYIEQTYRLGNIVSTIKDIDNWVLFDE